MIRAGSRFDVEADKGSIRAKAAQTMRMSIQINNVAQKLPVNNESPLGPMKLGGNGLPNLSVANRSNDLEGAVPEPKRLGVLSRANNFHRIFFSLILGNKYGKELVEAKRRRQATHQVH